MMITWIDEDDTTALNSSPKILADMKQKAGSFGPKQRYMFESIPEDTPCWHNRLSQWVPEQW